MSFKVTRKAVADREEAAQAMAGEGKVAETPEAPEVVTGDTAEPGLVDPLLEARSSGSTLEQGPDALEEMRRERRRIAQAGPPSPATS